MIRHLHLFALPLFAIPVCVHAQAQVGAAPSDDQRDEGEIVVSATRTVLPPNALPLTIDVIDSDELDQQVAVSGTVIDAVSTLVPSFSPTRQKLSGAGESLRGRSPLYAINGIPQSTPLRDGSRDGFTIDPFFVDRVEVIFGSNALQGIGGAGGIVNQVTIAPPAAEGLSGRVQLRGTADNGFHSNGFGKKAAGLLQYRAGEFDATVGAAYETRGIYYDGDDRRVGGDITQGETQDSKSWSVFGRFGYALGDSARLDLMLNRFELKGDGDYIPVNGSRALGIPSTTAPGTPQGRPPANRTESAALTLTDDDLGGGKLIAQLFWNRSRDTFGNVPPRVNDTFQDPTIAPNGTLFDQSQNRSRKYGGKISYERGIPGFEDLTVLVGADMLYDLTEQRLISTGRAWVPPTDFRSIAPFAQGNLKLLDGIFRIAGGVRWENVRIKIDDYRTLASTTLPPANGGVFGGVAVDGGAPKFDDVLLNAGVIAEPIQGVRAYASYAQGFSVPDVGRITRSIGTAGEDIDSYLNIRPIVFTNKEVGVEVKRGPLDASASYYWSDSKEGSLLILVGDSFVVQRQPIKIEGLELNLGVQTPIEGLKVNIGYAHLNGRTDANNDGTFERELDGANISPDRLNLSASYASGPFSARIQSQFYLKKLFDIPQSVANLPNNMFDGYNVTDATLRYETGFGAFTLAAANIFDTFYIDYNSDTQRATDNARFYAGRGRTFSLGWDYRF